METVKLDNYKKKLGGELGEKMIESLQTSADYAGYFRKMLPYKMRYALRKEITNEIAERRRRKSEESMNH